MVIVQICIVVDCQDGAYMSRIKAYPCPTRKKLPYKHSCTLEHISYRLDGDMPLAGQETWKTIHKRKEDSYRRLSSLYLFTILLNNVKLADFLVLLYAWLLLYTKTTEEMRETIKIRNGLSRYFPLQLLPADFARMAGSGCI